MNKHLLLEITTPSGVVRQDIRIQPQGSGAAMRGQPLAPIRVPLTENGSMTLIDKATGKPVRIRKSARTDGNLVLELEGDGVQLPEIVLQNFDDAACVMVGAPNQGVNDTVWPPQANPLHSNQICDPGTDPLSFKWPEALAASGVTGTGLGMTLQSAGAMLAVADDSATNKTAVNNTVVGVAPITGKVSPGAKVTVKDSMGNVLGETTADPVTGDYELVLSTRPANQTAVQITIADTDGTVLQTISVPVDLTPPATPTVIAASSTEVRGVADPGTIVRLIDGSGQVIGTGTADTSTGIYSITPTTTVTNTAALTVQAVDAGGNSSTQSTVAADTTPPVTPTTSPSNGQNITGTAEPGSTVSINDPSGKVLGTVTADAVTGRFTYTPTTPLAHGTMVRVIATDAAGNFSLSSTVTVDSQAPTLPLVTTRTGGTLAGTAEADATILIDLGGDGTIDRRVTVDGLGNFSASFSPALTDGQALRISVADSNSNTSVPIPVTIDAVAPNAATVTTSTTTTLAGTAEPGATISVDVNGDGRIDFTQGVSDDRSWSIALSPAPAAGATASVTVTDTAGNRSTATTASLTASSTNTGGGTTGGTTDTTAPVAATLTTVSTTTVAGTGEAGATVLVDVDGNGQPDYTATVGSNGTFSVTLNPALVAGTAVSVRLRDAANNTSTATAGTVSGGNTGGNTGGDTGGNTGGGTAPSAPTLNPSNGSTLSGSAQPGMTIRVDLNGDGTTDLTTLAGTDGRWSITLTEAPADGTTVSITAVNAAGTVSSASTVVIDGVSPQAPTLTRVSSNLLSGRSEPLARIDVDTNGDGTADLGTTADSTGQWSITPNPSLADGSSLSIRQLDRAGNPSAAVTAVVDSSAPTAATVNPSNGVSFTGTAEAGATVTLDSNGDGMPDLSTIADSAGAWTLTPETRVAGGTTVTVRVTDAAGNVSTPATMTVVDTTPAAPTVNPASGTGISGTAAPGMTILLDTNGDGLADQSTTAGTDGSWSFGFSPALADGASLAVRAVNASGETSDATTAIVDAVPPAAPTVNPSTGNAASGTAPAGASVLIDSDGDGAPNAVVTADGNGSWSYSFPTALTNGAILTISTRDAAGNVSTGVSVTVAGSTAIAAPSINPFNGSLLSGTAQAGLTIQIDTNGDGSADLTATADSNGLWSTAISPALAHGSTVTVRAADGSGQTSAAVSATTDANAPAAATITLNNGSTISGTAEAGSTVRIDTNGDGSPDLTAIADGAGSWSVTPSTPLANGTNLSVTVVDAAGNSSAATTSTVNTSGLTAPTLNASNGMTLAGSAAPNASVAVDTTGDGTADYTATADGSGAWMINLNPVLAHGTSVNAWVVGGSGGFSPTTTVTVDTQAPAAPTVNVSSGSTLSGTAEAGAVIGIDTDGDGLSNLTATAAGNGTWSVSPSPALSHGTVVSLRATDAAGNTGTPASVTIDANAPAATMVNASNGSTLSGTAEANATVQIDANGDGTFELTATADSSGTWTLTPASQLAAGSTVTLRTVDAAGNLSPTTTLTIDGTAPAAPGVSPSNGMSLSGTAEAGATIRIDTNGDGTADITVTAGNDGLWTTPLSPPLGGGTVVSIRATDTAGNTGSAASITIDGTAPAAATINPTNGSTVSGTAEAGATITVDTNGDGTADANTTANSSGQWSIALSPAPAHNSTLTVGIRDAAGNAGPNATVTVDAVAPVAPGTNPSNGSLVYGDAEPNATIQIDTNNDGAADLTTTVNTSGFWTLSPPTAIANGTVLQIRAVDQAGNASAPASLTVDNNVPNPPVVNPSNGQTISGTASPGLIVALDTNEDGSPDLNTVANGSGIWSITPSTPIPHGTLVSVVAATNLTNYSAPSFIRVDAQAPAAPAVLVRSGSLISGTAEAGAAVLIDTNNDGSADQTVTANGSGAWSHALSPALADGTTVSVRARDAAGNTSTASSATIDATAPAAPTINASNGATLTGTAEANATVRIDTNGDGTPEQTVTANGSGAWSASLTPALAHGSTVSAIAVDAAGNTSSAASIAVDANAPAAATVAAISASAASGTAEANASVLIDTNGDGTTDQTVTADSAGAWAASFSPALANGTAVSVRVRDAAGNLSNAATATVNTGSVATPTIAASNGSSASGTSGANATILVDTNGDGTAEQTVTANGSGAWTASFSPALAHGTVITVTASDGQGTLSATASTTVDANAPTPATITTVTASSLAGTAEANASVAIDTNGDSTADLTVTANSSGAWVASLSPALAHGTVVTVRVVDAAGNSSTATSATVDANAPAAATVAAISASAASGTAEANAAVLIDTNGDGNADQTVTADGAGAWSASFSPVLAHGASVSVRVRDAAGNLSSATTAIVDANAPAAPTVAASNGSTVSGSAEANATLLIDTNGDGTAEQTVTANGSGAWSANLSPSLANGAVISVRARDAAGNVSTASQVTVDAVAPDAPTLDSSNGSSISGVAEPGATIRIDTDGNGTANATTLADTFGFWSATLTPALADGTEVAVVAVDAAGNISSASTLSTDASIPTAPVINPSQGTVISGTAGANLTVELDVDGDGNPDETATANAQGDWSITLASALPHGTLVIANAVSGSGARSASALMMTDSQAPAAPTVTTWTAATLAGTAEANAALLIDLNNDGTADQTITADGSGAWSASLSPALADGTIVSVRARDAANNLSTATNATIDAVPPSIPVITPTTGSQVSGTAAPNATILIDTDGDGNVDYTTTANGAGAWSQVLSPPLAHNTSITVWARDAAGNLSLTATAATDSQSPAAATITTRTATTLAGTAEAWLSVGVDTNNDGTIDQSTTVDGTGVWSITLSPTLAHGSTVQVFVEDYAGNTSTAATATIDAIVPAIPTVVPSTGTTLSGTGTAGSTIQIDTDGNGIPNLSAVVDGAGNWTVNASPALAHNTVASITAVDDAGNVSAPTTVTVDSVVPSVPVVNPSNGSTLSGTAEPNATLRIDTNGDGTAEQTTTASGAGLWSIALSPTVADGTVIAVRAVDATGNVSGPGSVTVNANVPATPTLQPSNGTLLQGTATANITIDIDYTGDGQADATTNADASGNWSYTPAPALAHGTSVSVVAVNGSGATSAAAIAVIDNVAPTAAVVEPSNGTELRGTAEAITTVGVDLDGDGDSETIVTVNSAGNWSTLLSPTLPHGTVVTLRVTDAAGNVSSTSTVTIDANPPAAPVITASNASTLSGTSEAGASILIDTNGDGSADLTVIADGTGAWTATHSPALAHGTALSVRARDAAGNLSTATAATVDAIAPTAPVVAPSSGVTITGTAEANSTITVDTNGDSTPEHTTTADGAGAWSITPASAIAHGTTLTVRATDASGNVSSATTRVVDSTSPTPPVIAPSNGSTLNGTAEPNATVLIDTNNDGSTDITVTADGSGVWTTPLSPPAVHGTTLAVRVRDAAGNTSSASTHTIDTVAPDAPVVTTRTATTLAGTGEVGATISIDLTGDGSADTSATVDVAGNWTAGLSPAQADGVSVQIRAVDASLNTSAATVVTIDATVPNAPVVLPSNGQTLGGTAEANATVLIDTNGDNSADLTVTADGAGAWSATPASALPHGTTVGIRVRDAAGNLGNTTQITVDAVAPTAPTLLARDADGDGNPDLSGTAEAGSSITLTDASGATHTSTADGTGNFSVELSPAPTPLIGSYSVTARDAAGNTSTSTAVSATDLTSPTIIDALPVDEGRVGSAANLIVRYSENIALGSGNIRLVSLDGGADITIDVSNHAGQLIVNNDFLQINPASDLPLDRPYALRIDTGAITDTAGNGFAGIVDNTTLNFTTQIAAVWTSEVGTASAGFIVSGASAGDMLSHGALAGAGDVNGDGYDDFIVGTVGQDGNSGTTNDPARSYVVFGSSTGANIDLTNLGSQGFMIQGEAGNAGQPVHVSAAGDVNGDGLQDLLIGSPFNDVAGIDNGAAYVVFGRNATSTVELSNLGSSGFRISGNTLGGMAGIAVAGVGDVNADGIDDVAVRVRYDDALATTPGNSYVVFGSSTLANSTVNLNTVGSSTAGFVIANEGTDVQADEQAPTISGAGDIDGDGYADLLIGSPLNDSAATNAGRAYVIRGGTSTDQVQLSAIAAGSSSRGFVINNTVEAAANTGYAVAGLGDFNGDGLSDMLVTVSSFDGTATDAGAAYVVFGSTSGAPINLTALDASGNGRGLRLLAENETGTQLGLSGAAAGDFNGDGLADLLVSAPRDDGIASDTGRTYVVYGRTGDSAIQLSDIARGQSTQGFVIDGTGGADRSGQTVSAAGDLNGDSYADLLVGASQADPSGRANAGAAYVIYGGTRYSALVDNSPGSGAMTINGTSSADTLYGAAGNDTITGAGGADVIRGGSGDDLISIDGTTAAALMVPIGALGVSDQLATIDGGNGFDTLRLTGGAELSPIARAPRVRSIEQIDAATDTAGNIITLFATDMLHMGSSNVVNTGSGWTAGTYALGAAENVQQIVIDGSSADTLNLGGDDHPGGWQDVGTIVRGSDSFTVYQHTSAQAQVIVRQGVVVNNADAALQAVNLSSLEASGQGFVVNGQSMGDMSGTSAAYAGDINGDGYDDLLIGAYGAVPPAGVDAGKGYVVFGGPGLTTVELSAIEAGTGGFAIRGGSAGDKAGFSMQALGDLNGDGLADFGIGALNADVGANSDAGHSYVVYGRTATSVVELTAIAAGTGGYVIRGQSAGDESGRNIAAAGDVNGDGIGDLIIEASNAAVGANAAAGRAYVVFGNATGVAVELSDVAAGTGGFVINGEAADDHAGIGATAAGDVNGDGLGDVILGAYGANGSGGVDAGRAYVVFGKTDTAAVNLTAVTAGTGGFTMEGQAPGDGAGHSVTALGDVNGDGLSDVAVGAYLGDPLSGADAGHSYVVYGRSSGSTVQLSALAANNGGRVIEGVGAGTRSGVALTNAGDINGDGLEDLLIGAHLSSPNGINGAGSAYVVFGGTGPTVNLSDINAGMGGFAIHGASDGDMAGRYVSAAGDVNGDGLADLLVSAYAADPQARDMAGRSYVIYGHTALVNGEVAGSGTVTGTSVGEAIYGSSSSDTLTGGGGVDRYFAGAGNDTIVLTGTDVTALATLLPSPDVQASVDGGAGNDTVRLTGGASLDLTSIASIAPGATARWERIRSVERIDLATDTAANTLTLHARDVLDMTGMNLANTGNGWSAGTYALGATETRHQLVVDGSSADTLALSLDDQAGGWALAGTVTQGATTYQVYNHNSQPAQVLVQQSVNVTNADPYVPPVDLGDLEASGTGFAILGASAGDQTGRDVVVIGDINGDGLNDLVVGTGSGNRAYAVFGKLDSTPVELTDVENGTGGFVIRGETHGGSLSHMGLASIGDLNGDGLNDILVGDGSADAGANTDAGRAYVIFGKTGTAAVETSALGSAGIILNGGSAGESAGYSLSSQGDVNGDGVQDLIIGAARYNPGSSADTGRAYVVYGNTGLSGTVELSTLEAGLAGGFVINAASGGAWAGHFVSVVGDVNGDGLADMVVAADQSDPSGAVNAGEAYVVFGRSGTSAVELTDVANGVGGFALRTGVAGDNLGNGVGRAGDVNGDGLADLIVGAYRNNSDTGAAYVVFGRTATSSVVLTSLGSEGFAIFGQCTGDAFAGYGPETIGDINGDGLDDLYIGAPLYDGSTLANIGRGYVVFGKTDTTNVATSNLAIGGGGFIVDNTAATGATELASFSHQGSGDINGDGLRDLIMGIRAADNGALVDSGNAYAVFGTNAHITTANVLGTSASETLTGTSASEFIAAGRGNDVLIAGGGADVLHGGAGDDVLVINSSTQTALMQSAAVHQGMAARLDGGEGVDTLRLSGGQRLDLTRISNPGAGANGAAGGTSRLTSIEQVDMATDTGFNSLTLSAADVIDMAGMNLFNTTNGWSAGSYALGATERRHQMVVTGTIEDSLSLDSGWTSVGMVSQGSTNYSVFNHSTLPAQILAASGTPVGLGQTLAGTAGNDTLNDGIGSSVIHAELGVDTVSAGAGNDILIVGPNATSTAAYSLEGGNGFDTLRIQGQYVLLDAVNNAARTMNLEAIDVGAQGPTVFLDANAVATMIGAASGTLRIDGTFGLISLPLVGGSQPLADQFAVGARQMQIGSDGRMHEYSSFVHSSGLTVLVQRAPMMIMLDKSNGTSGNDTIVESANWGSGNTDGLINQGHFITDGAGDDTVTVSNTSGAPLARIFAGDGGNDTYNGSANVPTTLYYQQASQGVSVVVTSHSGPGLSQGTVTSGSTTDSFTNIRHFSLSDHNDSLNNSAAGVDDGLTVYGFGGDDTLTTGAGTDTLDGGLGNDTLDGGTGSDTAVWHRSLVNQTVDLQAGTSTSSEGNDTLANFENASTGFGNDTIRGNSDANRLDGGVGSDTLEGLGGNDNLVMDVPSINDEFNGQSALSTDIAVFATVDGSLPSSGGDGGVGTDTIIGFQTDKDSRLEQGEDILNLSGLFAAPLGTGLSQAQFDAYLTAVTSANTGITVDRDGTGPGGASGSAVAILNGQSLSQADLFAMYQAGQIVL